MSDTFLLHIKYRSLLNKIHTSTTFELLLVTFLSILLVWYLQFLWNRRRLYRCAFKLPGPFAFPFLGSALYFIGSPYDIFSNIMMMFKKYPGIFRVWFGHRLFYAVSDPRYFEILLPNCLKKEYLYHHAEPVVGHGLFTAPLDTWKRHRKTIMPTFSQKILDSFVEIFSEQANILVEQLKKHSGKDEFDIFHSVSTCTLDIICDHFLMTALLKFGSITNRFCVIETAMGVKVNAQTTDAPYTKWTDRLMEIVFLRIFVFWYHFDFIFNRTTMAKDFTNITRSMHNYNRDVIREKMKAYEELKNNSNTYFEDGPKRRTFLDYLIELTSGENSKFTEQELIDEVSTFIIAGSDTTASTNSFAFLTLGLHQDMQQKVYEEILEVVGPTRSVEPADLPQLKYTERFIKETLRLFPVGGIIVRAVEEDVDLGDLVVPAGVSVVFGILRTHTNEEYWPEPYKFDPDRFLPEQVAKRHPCAYIPFSYGPRNCVGVKYAMMAMKALLATAVRRYKISTSYKSEEDIKLKANLVLRPKDGYKVSIQLR